MIGGMMEGLFSEDGSFELPDGFELDNCERYLAADQVAMKYRIIANRKSYLEKERLLKECAELTLAVADAKVAVARLAGIDDGG